MKNIGIGSTVATKAARRQNEYKWVVLYPLSYDEDGDILGGAVYALTQNRAEAEGHLTLAEKQGASGLIVGGCNSRLSVNEVFVE